MWRHSPSFVLHRRHKIRSFSSKSAQAHAVTWGLRYIWCSLGWESVAADPRRKKVTIPRSEGVGRLPSHYGAHGRRRTPLHGCLSRHLKWKCTWHFKRCNHRVFEFNPPPPPQTPPVSPSSPSDGFSPFLRVLPPFVPLLALTFLLLPPPPPHFGIARVLDANLTSVSVVPGLSRARLRTAESVRGWACLLGVARVQLIDLLNRR